VGRTVERAVGMDLEVRGREAGLHMQPEMRLEENNTVMELAEAPSIVELVAGMEAR
jgi:hypothetical protein